MDMKFRKKPVVIDAMLYDGDNKYDICKWSGDKVWYGYPESVGKSAVSLGYEPASDLRCSTLEGDLRASVGDWIIKGVAGEFYPCKPDIFEQTYEPASVPVLETPPPREWICPDCGGSGSAPTGVEHYGQHEMGGCETCAATGIFNPYDALKENGEYIKTLWAEIAELKKGAPVEPAPAPHMNAMKLETCYDELLKLPLNEWGDGEWYAATCRDMYLSGYAQAMKDAGIVSKKRIVSFWECRP
jgi:hypothetical protein